MIIYSCTLYLYMFCRNTRTSACSCGTRVRNVALGSYQLAVHNVICGLFSKVFTNKVTLYQQMTAFAVMVFHKPTIIHMGGGLDIRR